MNNLIKKFNNLTILQKISFLSLIEESFVINEKDTQEIEKNFNKEEIKILPGVKVLRNDNEYFIAEINSWKSAKYYGKGTNWSISREKERFYWTHYHKNSFVKFIYVRDFQYPDLGINSDPNYKLMIKVPYIGTVYIDNKTDYSKWICEIWDAKDRSYDLNIQEISNKFGLNPRNIINANVIEYSSNIDFNTKEGIKKWLDISEIINYVINDNLTVDVDGDVNLNYRNLIKIPIQFGKVNGNFYCDHNNLKSLKGSPIEINGDFNCSHNENELETLEGSPKVVNGNFYCHNNNLISLKGSPKKVDGNFYCHYNQLESLEGAPEIVTGYFDCSISKLKSLKGSPRIIGGSFNCSHNDLISLEGVPNIVKGNFNCSDNPKLSKEYLDNFDFSFVKGKVIFD